MSYTNPNNTKSRPKAQISKATQTTRNQPIKLNTKPLKQTRIKPKSKSQRNPRKTQPRQENVINKHQITRKPTMLQIQAPKTPKSSKPPKPPNPNQNTKPKATEQGKHNQNTKYKPKNTQSKFTKRQNTQNYHIQNQTTNSIHKSQQYTKSNN